MHLRYILLLCTVYFIELGDQETDTPKSIEVGYVVGKVMNLLCVLGSIFGFGFIISIIRTRFYLFLRFLLSLVPDAVRWHFNPNGDERISMNIHRVSIS